MFLEAVLQRNPGLIQAAFELHRSGRITPNTYVIDVDAVGANAAMLAEKAAAHGIDLYMMTKQFGRLPALARIIAAAGIKKAVAVDPWEALALGRAGIELGNVGHLVQVPSGMLTEILSFHPQVMTVFSVEKAREISAAAADLGRKQDLLLKVVAPGDMVYEAQLGGFASEELLTAAAAIADLPNVEIAGVTAFPCFLFNEETGKVEGTPNLETVLEAASQLRTKLGLNIWQINTPSNTCVATIPALAEAGATHGEPGHAFTGTTPLHADGTGEEIPALVYVTEVSHLSSGQAYVYGGGFYSRSQLKKAMVGRTYREMSANILPARPVQPEYIDYYAALDAPLGEAAVGDTVIYSFRTQIFVTRAQVALVEGISRGKPVLASVAREVG